MNPREVEAFGLWTKNGIEAFLQTFKPDYVVSLESDEHFGAENSNFPADFECLNHSIVQPPPLALELWKCREKFWKIQDLWKSRYGYFIGDMISAVAKFGNNGVRDLIDIDNQKELAVFDLKRRKKNQLHKMLDRQLIIFPGTPAHDSLDTKTHHDIAAAVGAEFESKGYRIARFGNVGILMNHVTINAGEYPLGLMERETVRTMVALWQGLIDKCEATVGGHWHRWGEADRSNGKKGYVEVTLPGWQGFYMIKNRINMFGTKMPQIGGMTLLVRGSNFVFIPYIFPIKTM
jgi:hypothetical protein